MTLASRFWEKVDKSSACWLWKAAQSEGGYGVITTGSRPLKTKRVIRAHRLSWELHNGPIPPGKCILHKCDVRHCVRPDHLWVGTYLDNNQDMAAKGRWNNQYKLKPPTHCKRGHEFSVSNTRRGSKGERVCKACMALWARVNRKSKREARRAQP